MSWLYRRALGRRAARAMERSRAADWLVAFAAAYAGSLACASRMASSSVITTGAWAPGGPAADSPWVWPYATSAANGSRSKIIRQEEWAIRGAIPLRNSCQVITPKSIHSETGFCLEEEVAAR